MIIPFNHHTPQIDDSCFIASDADLIGQVQIDRNASVFYHAVIRGDSAPIVIGEGTNVQDGCIIHCDPPHPVTIGRNVSIGHGAIVHGACIDDDVLIGMGAVILNGAHIASHTLIAAKALIKEGMQCESGWLYAGIPAKAIRPLREGELASIESNARHYQELSQKHKEANQ